MVQDMERKSELVSALSNGAISGDLKWTLTTETNQFSTFCIATESTAAWL